MIAEGAPYFQNDGSAGSLSACTYSTAEYHLHEASGRPMNRWLQRKQN